MSRQAFRPGGNPRRHKNRSCGVNPGNAALYICSAISIFQRMKKSVLSLIPLFCLLAFSANAQSLPKIELQPVLTKLIVERPMWISEAPDGSGRLFVVYQPGKILIVKKGSDGGDAKEFLNIEDRHPYFENEDGLMSIAFHPGFTTNGLFYIYYNQKNPADQHSQPQNYPVPQRHQRIQGLRRRSRQGRHELRTHRAGSAAAVLESQGRRSWRLARTVIFISASATAARAAIRLAAAKAPRRCSPKCCALM